jgi:hypothetical protein
MDSLLNRLGSKVNGVIAGFDRIVFRGIIRPILYAAGMESYLLARKIYNKDFKAYVTTQSQAIVESAEEMSARLCGGKVIYIPSLNERKEALAHAKQKERGVKEGLIGVWSCVESCDTFKSTYDPTKTNPSLRFEQGKCKHLYYYFDDPDYGFMSARLQTWAPYEIQFALNGREWLRRSLDKAGCGYYASGNKFLHIDDYGLAQNLLDAQANTDFAKLLAGFLPTVFPRMADILGPGLSYYWTYWQSEVARDYIFKNQNELSAMMDDYMIHAMITGSGERILKYFGSPVRKDGQPHHSANPEIISRAKLWYDGARVRHWNHSNSVKFYNEHNVLRFEMTMNDPTDFVINRHAEGQSKDEAKKRRKMRKGVSDTAARVEISKNIINRFTEQMSTVDEKTRLGDILGTVAKPVIRQGNRIRALDVFGKDRELLRAIADPALIVHSITNKELQSRLVGSAWAKGMSGKQLSSRISRNLRFLRDHGLIKKLPNQRRYALTDKGRKLTTAIDAAESTSVNDLLRNAV